jgi:hypothetical protein
MTDVLSSALKNSQWSLQSPAMLYFLLALVIPIVIHLFNISRGKLVPIGDIRLIATKKLKKMTEIRLIERLLLALRLLLIILISLLLAQLFLSDEKQIIQSKSIFVTQDWLNVASLQEKQVLAEQLDAPDINVSLLSNINEGVIPLTLPMINSNRSETNEHVSYMNVWLQVKRAMRPLESNSSITVYSTNRLSQFIGEKPLGLEKIDWHVTQIPDAEALISLPVPMKVLVVSDVNRREDVTYIRAALTALNENTLTGLEVLYKETAKEENELPDSAYDNVDVILYLSDRPLSSDLLQRATAGTRLVIDASANSQTVETAVNEHFYFNEPSLPDLYGNFVLHKMGLPDVISLSKPAFSSQVIWKTTSGSALLTSNSVGEGQVYSFYSRFNPSWSNWVLKPHFPYDLAELLINRTLDEELERQLLSRMRLTLKQISEKVSKGLETKSESEYVENGVNLKDKNPPFALVLFIVIVFCIERTWSELSLRRKRNTDDVNNLTGDT